MMIKKLFVACFFFLAFLSGAAGQKPLISHIYAADPSGHVWPTDTTTLWLYTSHDAPGTNHHATMFDYHVFSTKDLVHWTDYGRVLSLNDVNWAIGYAWAIDAVYRHNQYYLVYCMIEGATGMFRTGLAISDMPQGPFKDNGFIKGVDYGQDPCLFVDDDNTPYLYWGCGGQCWAAQLTDDLMSVKPGTKVELSSQLNEVYEGPWVHKYNGKYYLSYPALTGGKWPEEMCYAIADNPLGPYIFEGKYIPFFEGQAGTNHGSIVKFKNQWIAFHHAEILSGGNGYNRNLMADFLYYNPDGTIHTIIPDDKGITGGKTAQCIILLEAENAKAAGGRLGGTFTDNQTPGYSGKGYVTGFDVNQHYVEVLVQVAKDMKASLKIRYMADSDFRADILTGVLMMDGWDGTPFKKTNGWEIASPGEIQLRAGDNRIRFICRQKENLKVDYIRVEPEIY